MGLGRSEVGPQRLRGASAEGTCHSKLGEFLHPELTSDPLLNRTRYTGRRRRRSRRSAEAGTGTGGVP
eukprot:scaffold2972_cov64-Phaeocystis_antarctica.AAC.7